MTAPSSTLAPTVAERVRSACATTENSVLAIDGGDPVAVTVHHLRPAGDVIVAVPLDTPQLAGTAAVLELADHAPIPLREPVRSLVWLRGTLRAVPDTAQRTLAADVAATHPHPALLDVGHTTRLLRLVLDSAVVADATGAQPVCVDELRLAAPDPFYAMESAWLRHLDSDHPDVIDALGRKLPTRLRRGRIRPLAIDRYGLTLRIEGYDGDNDVRLPFAAPVSDVEGLGRAVRTLMGCPFMNGLRPATE